jgi:hypothetical protein
LASLGAVFEISPQPAFTVVRAFRKLSPVNSSNRRRATLKAAWTAMMAWCSAAICRRSVLVTRPHLRQYRDVLDGNAKVDPDLGGATAA